MSCSKCMPILFLLAFTTVFNGCQSELQLPENQPINIGKGNSVAKKFSTSHEGTKASLAQDGYSVVWNKGDALLVFDGTDAVRFDIEDESINGGKATFKGTVSEGATHFFALSPYDSGAELGKYTADVTLPAEQAAVDGGFDPACCIAAAVTDNDNLRFNNLVALVKVRLEEDANSIRLKGNADEALAGSFSVELNPDNSVAMISGGSEKEIVLSGTLKGGSTYCIAVIGDKKLSKGLSVSAFLENGKQAVKTVSSEISLKAGVIVNVDMADASVPSLFGSDVLTFSRSGNGSYRSDDFTDLKLLSEAPKGWTVTLSADGRLDIKAPDTLEGSDLFGDLKFSCKAANGRETVETVTVRIYGVNNKQDLLDARDAILSGGDSKKFMSASALSLNADVSIDTEDMLPSGTFFYALTAPLNGNGHTITINSSNRADANSLIEYLRANVMNLNLAGSLVSNGGECRMAPLAANAGYYAGVSKTVTISNVTSSVDVSYAGSSVTNSKIGGLVCSCIGSKSTISFVNCKVTGKLRTSQALLDLGGLVGRIESSSPGEIVKFTDCEFAGEIEYNQRTIHANPRVGGFVASGERRSMLTRCVNNGKITLNLNNTVFDPDGGGGAGGILGRSSAVVSGYNMGWYLNAVTTNCIFTVNGQPSGATTAYFGKIIGSKKDEAMQYDNVVEGGTLTINVYGK